MVSAPIERIDYSGNGFEISFGDDLAVYHVAKLGLSSSEVRPLLGHLPPGVADASEGSFQSN
jgi:hypothetical protein